MKRTTVNCGPFCGVELHCNGSRLASGSFDKTVTIWTLDSDRLGTALPASDLARCLSQLPWTKPFTCLPPLLQHICCICYVPFHFFLVYLFFTPSVAFCLTA
ncbi:hypothetical protein EMCRGX_G030797 [Ephydatia muelleri]